MLVSGDYARFYDGITGVEKGFFDAFITLKELVVPESVRSIGVTEPPLPEYRVS